MEKYKQRFQFWINYYIRFLKWIMVAVVIGLIGGIVGAAFHECVQQVTSFRGEHFWVLFLLPLAGIVIVFLYHRGGMRKDPGTNLVLESIHTEESVPFRMAPLIFIATVLTHLCGGSAGREGAALQLGGSLGATFAKVFHLEEHNQRVLVMCGMSAVFTAMFGTPITAAIFSMEVVQVGILYYSALVPCLVAAAVAYGVLLFLGMETREYMMDSSYTLTVSSGTRVMLLAMLCGLIGILFCVAMHEASHFMRHKIANDYVRVAVGGVAVILLTLLVGTTDYNGASAALLQRALHDQVTSTAFLWKIVFTAITIGAGFKGGEIVPTLTIGATFGSVAGPLLGLDPSFAAAIGMIALFCAVVNCPVASIFLALELFGQEDIVLFALACGVSYVISGYFSLYSSQSFRYAKTRLERIDKNAK